MQMTQLLHPVFLQKINIHAHPGPANAFFSRTSTHKQPAPVQRWQRCWCCVYGVYLGATEGVPGPRNSLTFISNIFSRQPINFLQGPPDTCDPHTYVDTHTHTVWVLTVWGESQRKFLQFFFLIQNQMQRKQNRETDTSFLIIPLPFLDITRLMSLSFHKYSYSASTYSVSIFILTTPFPTLQPPPHPHPQAQATYLELWLDFHMDWMCALPVGACSWCVSCDANIID